MVRLALIVVAVFSVAVLAADSVSAVQYAILDLGPISPDTQSFAYGVQRFGGNPTAAGRSNSSGQLTTWTESGGTVTASGHMSQFAGIGANLATAYNLGVNGDIVGNCTISGVTKGFYLPNGGSAVLVSNLGGTSQPVPWGTAQGRSAGYAYDASGVAHAVVWDSTGAVTDLGLGGSTTGTWARGISPDGLTVVGDWDNTPGQDGVAAKWTYSGGTWTLTKLIDKAMYNQSTAYSINSSGDICGVLWNYGSGGFPSTTRHVLLIKHTGQIVDLGDLGGTSGIGYSINDSGVVVGTDIGTGCFVNYYGQTGVNQSLNLYNLILNPGPWTSLSYAYNIDNAGDITGRGYRGSVIHGYMLVPALAGDANLDGTANVGDLSRVLSNYDKSGLQWADGDFNGDGTVNVGDMSSLLSNYDKSVSAAGGGIAVVPEPSTLLLASLASAGLAIALRSRRN